MHLFKGRPLAWFCCAFLLASLLFALGYLSCSVWGFAIFAVLISAILISYLFFKSRDIKIRLTYLFLTVIFVFAAFVTSYFGIQLKREAAQNYIGEQSVEMLVISEEAASENYTEYIVKIKKLGDEPVNVKALLLCNFESKAGVCDTIYAKAEISYSEEGITSSQRDILLTAAIEEGDGAVYRSPEGESLWQRALSCGWDGIYAVVNALRHKTVNYFKDIFGEEYGALSAGLIMNDKSDIAPETVRDFRRSGASHLLAVSGLHVSLLLGFLDLVLRRSRVHKNVRCIVITALSVILLAATGFSVSACRAVFMLLILYLSYVFMEENDSVTSLFVAVFVIILISPYSVYDLGLWMSFMATLGLVSVFPLLRELIKNIFHTKLPRNFYLKALRKITEIICVTLVANMFLLPVMWLFFGEISIASVPVNLLVSPIMAALLPCIAVGACVGAVPVIGDILVFFVSFLSRLLLAIISFFAKGKFATVSFSYGFTPVIMWIFIIFFTAFLLVKLKHKWLVYLPCVFFAVAFSICLLAHYLTHGAALFYYSGSSDVFMSVNDGSAAIVDVSGGSVLSYSKAIKLAKEKGAVVIDEVVIADISDNHAYCVEFICRNNIVNRVYIQYPDGKDSASASRKLYSVAEKYGVELIFFDAGEELTLNREISAYLTSSSAEFSYDDGGISYFCIDRWDAVEEYRENCEIAIFKNTRTNTSVLILRDRLLDIKKNNILDIKELLD